MLGIPTLSAQDPQLGTPAEGIGFAIPSDTVRAIAVQLIRDGKVTRSDRASLELAGQTRVNGDGSPVGVAVAAARHGGAAAAAGIKRGDVIVGVGGHPTLSLNQLDDVLIDYRPGQRVKVEMLRDGAPRQVTAALGMLTG